MGDIRPAMIVTLKCLIFFKECINAILHDAVLCRALILFHTTRFIECNDYLARNWF